MSLSARLKTHTITVEPYEGTSSSGPVFGTAVQVECRVEDQLREVPTVGGLEVVNRTTVYCDLDTVIPPESRVTVGGVVTTVLTVASHDTGGRSSLEHKEVVLK